MGEGANEGERERHDTKNIMRMCTCAHTEIAQKLTTDYFKLYFLHVFERVCVSCMYTIL